VLSGFRAVAETLAHELHAPFDLYDRMCRLFDTADRARVFNALVAELSPPQSDALVQRMVEIYRRHKPRIALYPDAAAALDRLAGRFRLGIISDGRLESQQAKLDALGIATRFAEIIFTDRWGRKFWKPRTPRFRGNGQRLDVAHVDCTYVADNPAKDFLAPNILDWNTVCVQRPRGFYVNAEPPRQAPPSTPSKPSTTSMPTWLPHALAVGESKTGCPIAFAVGQSKITHQTIGHPPSQSMDIITPPNCS